jgi:hypothetical protein
VKVPTEGAALPEAPCTAFVVEVSAEIEGVALPAAPELAAAAGVNAEIEGAAVPVTVCSPIDENAAPAMGEKPNIYWTFFTILELRSFNQKDEADRNSASICVDVKPNCAPIASIIGSPRRNSVAEFQAM